MDKKILLGGAAAVIMVGGVYATPASASIELSLGGEAQVMASMSDTCFTAASDTDLEAFLEAADSTAVTDTEAGINTYLATLTAMSHNAAAVTAATETVAGVFVDVDAATNALGNFFSFKFYI